MDDDDEMKFFECLYDLPVCDVVHLGELLGLNYADRFENLDDDDDDGYSELRFALLNEITDKVFS